MKEHQLVPIRYWDLKPGFKRGEATTLALPEQENEV